MNKQLYKFIKDVHLPSLDRFRRDTGEIISNEHILEGYYSYKWPNGSPCLLAEMYLLNKSNEVRVSKKDGGTLGNYATNLSHLIRYCYNNKVDFWDLTHRHIDELVYNLCLDTDIYNERIRNNNTVKTIIQNSMDFLIWVQDNIATDKLITGTDTNTKRYQIKLKEEKYTTPHGKIFTHHVFPLRIPRSTTSSISPISSNSIKLLWDALDKRKSSANVSNKLKGIFSKKEQAEHIEYMHKRRELQLILLEATGLRPQELITIPCLKNINYLQDSSICIPTLKGRVDSKINMRVIPISRNIAIKIELFITMHRKKFIKRLISAKIIKSATDIDDVIYLNSENGKEVLPDAAYQEFRRLAYKAGIKQKVCQKMFRHRFITNMVKLHLIGFMDKNPLKNRQIMTENDYRTILKKVASFTGHKSLDSLMHYIDLAWEELDAFSYTYEIKDLQDKLKSIFYSVHSIKNYINSVGNKNISKKSLGILNVKLQEIESLTS